MDFLCVGQMVADILMHPVEMIDYAVDTQRVDGIEMKSGGDSLNTALALAKLGQSVAFAGKCGMDAFGDFLCQTAENAGIDTRGVRRDSQAATSSVVIPINKNGDRHFLYYGGASDNLVFKDIDISLLDDCRFVHVGGVNSLTRFVGADASQLFSEARARGAVTSMDVAWDASGQWLSPIAPCLPHLDYFLPSIDEAAMITNEKEYDKIAAFLLSKGVCNVVLKLGAQGCYVQNEREAFYVPAYKVNAVDTTGAGDCFVAGFLTGLAQNWNLEKCARFGAAVAAHTVMQIGATTGVPTFAEALQMAEAKGLCL